MPRFKIIVQLLYRCPACRRVERYDGTWPARECPDCKKKAKDLDVSADAGSGLARKVAARG